MVSVIPKMSDLVCAPGDFVRVERFNNGEMELFEDTVSSIEIIADLGKWSAYYYFENNDDEAKHFEIQQVLNKNPNPSEVPIPKYKVGELIEYKHPWEVINRFDKISGDSIICTYRDEDVVRYIAARPADYIDEVDVIRVYVEKVVE